MDADSPDVAWTRKKVLIVGRATPEPSKKHIETVCTGGLTEEGEFLRLYPIPLRYLDPRQKYRQWSWAEFDICKSPHDKRKESYIVREDTIRVLGRVSGETERFDLLRKAIVRDRETLDVMYRTDWTSIGLIEINVCEFIGRTRRQDWAKAKPYTMQSHLYVKKMPLDQPTMDVQIRFSCKNNPNCRSHLCRLIGWEYAEALRNFTQKYGSLDGAFVRFEQELKKRYMDPAKQTLALMATHFKYGSWMVAQLFAFPMNVPSRLF